MRLEHQPETNCFGLVLPPTKETLKAISKNNSGKSKHQFIDRHHMYWPRCIYQDNQTTKEFREHRFNSVWLLREDHNNIHFTYDGVTPPPIDVMETYLIEAAILDSLDVCIKAIEMIDAALYAGRVRQVKSTESIREGKIDAITYNLAKATKIEIIPRNISQSSIHRATQYALIAA